MRDGTSVHTYLFHGVRPRLSVASKHPWTTGSIAPLKDWNFSTNRVAYSHDQIGRQPRTYWIPTRLYGAEEHDSTNTRHVQNHLRPLMTCILTATKTTYCVSFGEHFKRRTLTSTNDNHDYDH